MTTLGNAIVPVVYDRDAARTLLGKDDCALVVVDIQEKLLPPIHERERLLRNAQLLPRERNTLLLCGMETHICVMQTALGALNKGYIVHVASDAVGSRSEWNWRIGLERMQAAGALISSAETIIYELMGGSGTPEFKAMLPYLKS